MYECLQQVEREKARSLVSDVTIALQLEGGERRQKTFSSEISLSDMVESFGQNNEYAKNIPMNT